MPSAQCLAPGSVAPWESNNENTETVIFSTVAPTPSPGHIANVP